MAVEALREAKANVKGMIAIFTYGFDVADENFEKENVQLHTLSDYDNLLEQAAKSNYITQQESEALGNWRKDPANWN